MKYNPQPNDELKQTLHIVAHLDFLGATEKMKSPEQSSEFLQKLHMIYNDVIDVMTEKELSGDEGVNIRIFSDNIVIAKESQDCFDSIAIFTVFSYCCFFQAYALLHGLLVRGGISVGNFYMDEVFVFGEGLIKAHNKENKQAIYPRIIVDKSVLQGVGVRAVKDFWKTFDDMLEQDFDGELFLNFLSPLLHPNDKRTSAGYLTQARKSIISSFKKYRSDDKVKQKLLWLFNKYNELCERYGYPEQVIKENLDNEPDVDHHKRLSEEEMLEIIMPYELDNEYDDDEVIYE